MSRSPNGDRERDGAEPNDTHASTIDIFRTFGSRKSVEDAIISSAISGLVPAAPPAESESNLKP